LEKITAISDNVQFEHQVLSQCI